MSDIGCQKTDVRCQVSEFIAEKRCLPYRFRKSLIKRLYPQMLKDYAFRADFFGLTYEGNAGNYIERMIYLCGGYERFMLHFLSDYSMKIKKSNPEGKIIFWDIGANVGNHSLFMSQYADAVYAFEPFEPVRRKFEHNLNLNGIQNIQINDVGVGEKTETLSFYAPPEGSLGNGSFVKDCNPGNQPHAELRVVDLDAWRRENAAPFPSIVKLDVEGYEVPALKGARQTLNEARPLLIFELSDATRRALGGEKQLYDLLPPRYELLRFAKASRDRGNYRLAPACYETRYKRQDVIACPQERLEMLGRKIV